jgi:periplasmic protein TonB
MIVQDQLANDSMHTIDQFRDKRISDVTRDGPPPSGDFPAPSPSQASANSPAVPPEPDNLPVSNPDQMPEYPGGQSALLRFLGQNLQVPEDAVQPGQRVRVPVTFVVDKSGQIGEVEFHMVPVEILKKEVLRVIRKMPRWKPGIRKGQPVPVYFTLPIIFEVTEN